jgi:hypothetical protein
LIARCSEAADVVRAVKFSRANNLLVAVKGGGHNAVAARLTITLLPNEPVQADRGERAMDGADIRG